jgi:hypothetical protein
LAGTNGRQRLALSAQTYGVRAGGAVVKDKLFYLLTTKNKTIKRHNL